VPLKHACFLSYQRSESNPYYTQLVDGVFTRLRGQIALHHAILRDARLAIPPGRFPGH
jgi:hypothetical protein